MLEVFLQFSVRKLKQFEERIQTCLQKLSDEQIWWRGAEEQNAVGNLVLHLCGNLGQWLNHGVDGRPDVRQRDAEFAARGQTGKAELSEKLSVAVADACRVIEGLSEGDLPRRMQVQKYDLTVLEGIYHVVEHFGQHTGQIVYATKLLTSTDLGFYSHLSQLAHKQTTP
jgi:uncharacterized damage-inducible protein DinB